MAGERTTSGVGLLGYTHPRLRSAFNIFTGSGDPKISAHIANHVFMKSCYSRGQFVFAVLV